MITPKRVVARVWLSLLVAWLPCAALAQESPKTHPKERPSLSETSLDDLLLEEITVTARKKEERMMMTPISMTAMSGAALKDLNANDLSAVTRFTPNMVFGQSASDHDSARIYVRGVGQDDVLATADPGVAVYVDGVYLGRVIGANVPLNDIRRVEVLRGPQGTVFGKNTVGGAINVVTEDPSTVGLQSEFRTRLGSHGRFDVGGTLNVPLLEETLAARISFDSNYTRGFYKNEFDDSWWDNDRRISVRGKLRYTPGLDTTATLAFDRLYAREHNQGVEPTRLNDCDPAAGAVGFAGCTLITGFYAAAPGFTLDDDPWRGFHNGGRPGSPTPLAPVEPNYEAFVDNAKHGEDSLDVTGTSLTLDHEFSESLRAKSITAWRLLEAHNGGDGDGTAAAMLQLYIGADHHQFSQEFQLHGSSLEGRLDWVGGLWAFRESSATKDEAVLIPAMMNLAPLPIFNFSTQSRLNAETLSYAGFMNGDYELTDSLSLNTGVRYSWERKRFDHAVASLFRTNPIPGGGPTGPLPSTNVADKDRWDGWTFRLGLTQEVGDHSMVYGSFSNSFRSGGFNGRAGADPRQLESYAPESSKTVEVGAKANLLGGRLMLRTAAFYNRYSDIQLGYFTLDAAGVFLALVENAGRARILGLETEFEFIPAPGWFLAGGIGLTEAEFREFELEDLTGCVALPCPVRDVSDREFPNTPVLTFNVRAERRFSLPPGWGSVRVGADYAFQSKIYYDLANNDSISQNSFGLLGGRVAWMNPDESLEVALWGRNLLDREYLAHGLDFRQAVGLTTGFYGDPRTFGIDLTLRFE